MSLQLARVHVRLAGPHTFISLSTHLRALDDFFHLLGSHTRTMGRASVSSLTDPRSQMYHDCGESSYLSIISLDGGEKLAESETTI